jgi:hypothetical protein
MSAPNGKYKSLWSPLQRMVSVMFEVDKMNPVVPNVTLTDNLTNKMQQDGRSGCVCCNAVHAFVFTFSLTTLRVA